MPEMTRPTINPTDLLEISPKIQREGQVEGGQSFVGESVPPAYVPDALRTGGGWARSVGSHLWWWWWCVRVCPSQASDCGITSFSEVGEIRVKSGIRKPYYSLVPEAKQGECPGLDCRPFR